MLLRFTLGAAGALVLASTASAQNISSGVVPITSPIKDAGTYHMATGTWTRANSSSVALAGPEVIYDNTCTTGFFSPLASGEIIGDSGEVPSLSAPNPGSANAYTVNGFETAYCSYETAPITVLIAFFECYTACSAGGILSGLSPVAAYSLLSMPAGTPAGTQACWIVTFDLANTTFTFPLQGNCNGTYNGVSSADSFGWAFTVPAGTTGTTGTGSFLAGDPALAFNPSCGVTGDGTTFAGFNPNLAGSGIGLTDQFELESTAVASGCYWFGGYSGAGGAAAAGSNPFSGFYMELRGVGGGGGVDNTGASGCDCSAGNPSCFNASAAGSGCPNTAGGGAVLTGAGNATSVAANDTFSLSVTGGAPNNFGLILSGTSSIGPIYTVPNSAGGLCSGGTTQRSNVYQLSATGTVSMPTFDTAIGGGLYGQASGAGFQTYQFWYRDPGGAAGCTTDVAGSDFNFSNGWDVTVL